MYGAAAHIKHDIIPIVLVLVYHFLSHSYFSYSLRKGDIAGYPLFLCEVYVLHFLYL